MVLSDEEVHQLAERFRASGEQHRGAILQSFIPRAFSTRNNDLLRRVREERKLLADTRYYDKVREFYFRIAAGKRGLVLPLNHPMGGRHALSGGCGTDPNERG